MTTKFNSMLLKDKNIYKIIDDSVYVDETSFLNSVAANLSVGVDVLELKFKHISSKEILSVAKKVRELCSYFGALLVIFDRIDIAKLVEADGVVLDKTTMLPFETKKLVEDSMLIGFEYLLEDDSIDLNDKNIDFIVCRTVCGDLSKKIFILNNLD